MDSCFLTYETAKYFFYYPILALLCFNTITFVVTTWTLAVNQRSTNLDGLYRMKAKKTYSTVSLKCLDSFWFIERVRGGKKQGYASELNFKGRCKVDRSVSSGGLPLKLLDKLQYKTTTTRSCSKVFKNVKKVDSSLEGGRGRKLFPIFVKILKKVCSKVFRRKWWIKTNCPKKKRV